LAFCSVVDSQMLLGLFREAMHARSVNDDLFLDLLGTVIAKVHA